jgi:hypothetical protein
MAKVEFIIHNGVELLHLDFVNGSSSELKAAIKEATGIIAAKPENSVLTLTDVTGAELNAETKDAIKSFAAHNKPYVRAGAVVGVDGFKQVIFNFVVHFTKRNLKAFDNKAEGMDWLSNQ